MILKMKEIKHPIENGTFVAIESVQLNAKIYGTIIYASIASNYYFVIPEQYTIHNVPINKLLNNTKTHYLFNNFEEDYNKYFKPYETCAGFWIHKVAIVDIVDTPPHNWTLKELLTQLENETD